MRHNRQSIRLKNYDYTQSGMYFVTLCIQNDYCLLGKIKNKHVFPNTYGDIVIKTWLWIGQHFPFIELDQWILMPDHFHGIIIINNNNHPYNCRGGSRTAPTGCQQNRKSLGRIIGAFKTVSTKKINLMCNTPGVKLWQRNYYEHIIRNKHEYYAIRKYIIDNPKNWKSEN
jgi:REP element-mobilizing transposase RayT